MKEKKIIDYSRTYRRIEADKKGCALYIILLTLLALILVWLFTGELTEIISKFCKKVLEKNNPDMSVGIKSETYPFFGSISYVSVSTLYPGMKISLINAALALFAVLFCASMPWKGRPVGIYLIFSGTIHLINSLWFIFGGKYFPYSITVYSQLYILQEIGIWLMFFIMTVFATGIVGNKGLGYKLWTIFAVMLYSIVFGAVRYVVFIYLLYRFSVIYMALFYFLIGPMFDFLYLVMIYAAFINRMIKIYNSRDGREEWKWS